MKIKSVGILLFSVLFLSACGDSDKELLLSYENPKLTKVCEISGVECEDKYFNSIPFEYDKKSKILKAVFTIRSCRSPKVDSIRLKSGKLMVNFEEFGVGCDEGLDLVSFEAKMKNKIDYDTVEVRKYINAKEGKEIGDNDGEYFLIYSSEKGVESDN